MGKSDEVLIKELLEKARNIPERIENPIKDINLFSILGMEDKEVSAHSAFFYYVFKPFFDQKEQRIDDRNLRVLYDVLKNELEKTGEKIDNNRNSNDLIYIDIKREVVTSYGRLDFLITYSNKNDCVNAIVIELKIWAGEQPNQIERYNQYLEKNGYGEGKVLFLTPKNRSAETGKAINITLAEHIKKTLQEIADKEEENGNKSYSIILKQYIHIIDKLTKEGEKGIMSEGLDLIKTAEDIKAVDKLEKAKIQVLTNILQTFADDLQKRFLDKLEHCSEFAGRYELYCDSFKQDYLKNYYTKGRCRPELAFKLKGFQFKRKIGQKLEQKYTDTKHEYYPCFYIAIDYNLWVTLTVKKGNLDFVDIEDAKEAIIECGAKNMTKWYIDWAYITIDNQKVNFREYDKKLEGILRLLNYNEDKKCLQFKAETIERIAEAAFAELKIYVENFLEKNDILEKD